MGEAATPIDLIDPVPEPKTRRKRNGDGRAVAKVEAASAPARVSEGDAFTALFERLARDPSVDPARIQQFLDMKSNEEDRSARRAFLAAFAKLQADLPAIERKGTGHNKAKYARFEDFIQTIKPHLAANGFSLSFRLNHQGNVIVITGVLGHEDGHQETTDLPLPADTTGNKNAVQSWGSTISYGKRYVGMTLLGIATEDEDDDGKAADAGETITADQVKRLQGLIRDVNANAVRFLAYMSKTTGRDIGALTEIPASQFDTAVEALESKRSPA